MSPAIWSLFSSGPAVIVPALSQEESRGDVPAVVSGKGSLARTANLPTREGEKIRRRENWTRLRTETLFKELLNWKRVLARDTQIFDSISATVSAPGPKHQLQPGSQACSSSKRRVETVLLRSQPTQRQCQLVTTEGGKLGEESCTLQLSAASLTRSFPGLC